MGVKLMLVILAASIGATAGPAAAQDADLRLRAPDPLIGSGLATHLLPRFRFRTRIRIGPGEPADIALAKGAGAPVFRSVTGETWGFEVLTGDPVRAEMAGRFLDWLRSDPGRAAIAAFEIDGAPAFAPVAEAPSAPAAVTVEGDADAGGRLALTHCGRCHVVDHRNPYGGIGSAPSFGALRGAPDWIDAFAAFWVLNPHPAFTLIDGVTEPFPPHRPPAIAPIEMTLDETEAITAFVATLQPKDLGKAVEAR